MNVDVAKRLFRLSHFFFSLLSAARYVRRRMKRATKKGLFTTLSTSLSAGMASPSLTGCTSCTALGWSSSARSAATSATRVGGEAYLESRGYFARTPVVAAPLVVAWFFFLCVCLVGFLRL